MNDANEILYVLNHDAILIPSFHGLRWERLGPWIPFQRAQTKKKKKINACLFRVLAAKASSTVQIS